MTIDYKAELSEENLEKQAASLGETFLRSRGEHEQIITLHGHDMEVLSALKKHMENYFYSRQEIVSVRTEGDDGYLIYVGAYLR